MKYKAKVKSMNRIVNRHGLRNEIQSVNIDDNNMVRVVFFKDGTCINNNMKYGEEIILDRNPDEYLYDYVDNSSKNPCTYKKEWLIDITPCYTINIEGQEVTLSSELYEQLKEKIEEVKENKK